MVRNGAMTTDPLVTTRFDNAAAIGPWVRARLAAVHPAPAPDVEVRAHDWEFEGALVREWLLDPEPRRNDLIEAAVQRWALRLGVYQPGGAHVMAEGPCTILASVVLPGAPADLVRLLSMYWTLIIAFDDQVVEAGRAPEPYLRDVPRILLSGQLPERPDVFHLAFAEVRDGIIELGGAAVLPAFAQCVADAIQTYVRETQYQKRGELPKVEEYLRDAVANSHIVPGMLLQRLRPGLLPPGPPLPADLDHLARLVTVIARLENDLLSYRKDERDGAVNICWILASEYGVDPIRAVPIVVGMIDALRVQHDDLLDAILTDSSRKHEHKQATTISNWSDACYAWFLTVARYGVTR
jgi:hypothetical protein